ncbi:MAG: phosphoenolpyruvate--protein phosphotransferase [Rhodospirillaceae bacterium]|nr:MAG: phosphoenolpyruvate--protein phosphotransferase [Rhodospirillaceae bacterium]
MLAPKEIILKGLGVSPGIAIGTVHVRESGSIAIPEYSLKKSEVAGETKRLKTALKTAQEQIGRMKDKSKTIPPAAAEEIGFLLDAYEQMLGNSRLVRGAYRRIKDDRINAEYALQTEISDIQASFAALDDAYIAARMDDIKEVADRVIRALTKTHVKPLNTVPKGSIIICDEMTPADTAQLDPKRVLGFGTVLGGAQGHTAIMACALGLPAVLGTAGILQQAQSGDLVIIDGSQGRVILNPKPATLAAFEARQTERKKNLKRLERLRRQPSITRDGVDISLGCNVELPIEMPGVINSGASSIGLLRSEFMFMNRETIPSEEEQFVLLRDIVKTMDGRTTTIRTLDIGGEKLAQAITKDIGESAQSALGLRGIRLSLKKPELLESQIAAILRAGAFGPVRILLPMVSSTREVKRTRAIINTVAERLKSENIAIADPLPPVGVMIEIPSAALTADALAAVSDFFAVGSNDLTMYTIAVDRTDEQVADLYNPLHPAVLRLIQGTADAALRNRIPISICGEVAGNPRFTALLLGLGIRELSMSAHSLGAVKQRVREIEITAAQNRAHFIMSQTDTGRIAMLLDDFNGLV